MTAPACWKRGGVKSVTDADAYVTSPLRDVYSRSVCDVGVDAGRDWPAMKSSEVRRGRRRHRLGRAVDLPERQPVERRLLERLLVVRAVRAHRAEVLRLRLHELRADRAGELQVAREDRHQALGQSGGLAVAVAE